MCPNESCVSWCPLSAICSCCCRCRRSRFTRNINSEHDKHRWSECEGAHSHTYRCHRAIFSKRKTIRCRRWRHFLCVTDFPFATQMPAYRRLFNLSAHCCCALYACTLCCVRIGCIVRPARCLSVCVCIDDKSSKTEPSFVDIIYI